MCLYIDVSINVPEAKGMQLIILELELQTTVDSHLTRVLGTKLESSGRTVGKLCTHIP